MKKVQKKLMTLFCASIAISLLLVFLSEINIVPNGTLAESKDSEFVMMTVMEILTLCVIPLSLRLFKFKPIHTKLIEQKEQALLPWGTLRICLLALPMIVNAQLYYQYMNVAFGYLAIILFLCMFFIIPTMDRCKGDIEG